MDYSDLKSAGLLTVLPALALVPEIDAVKLRNELLHATPTARARFVEEITINVPAFENCVALIESYMRKTGIVKFPGGMRILGDGGEGKTFICGKILKRHPVEDSVVRRHCPVLYISLGKKPSKRTIIGWLFHQLGQVDLPPGKDEDDLSDLLVLALSACGVRVILVDEAHTLWVMTASRRKSGREAGPVGEWFKWLYDKAGIALVFLGKPGLESLFEADDQSDTRWKGKVILTAPTFGPSYFQILKAWDQALPMQEPAGLDSLETAERIFSHTKGNFRLERTLFVNAVLEAANLGASRLTEDILGRAIFLTFGSSPDISGAGQDS